MSIKLKYLCVLTGASGPSQPAPDCREEEMNTPLQRLMGTQVVFDFTPSPSSIEGVQIL